MRAIVAQTPKRRGALLIDFMVNKSVKIADIKPHPRNYNRHPREQIERLKMSLRTFGQVRSIVVWRNYIIAGHGVVEAATGLGWDEIRADILPEDFSEDRALAYIVADNEIARLGDPDEAMLAMLLQDAQRSDIPILAMGYDDNEFAALLRRIETEDGDGYGDPQGDPDPVDYNSAFEILITCDSEQQQTALLEQLSADGVKCRALIS